MRPDVVLSAAFTSQGGFSALLAHIMLGLKTVWCQSHCGLQ